MTTATMDVPPMPDMTALAEKVRSILNHVEDLPPQAEAPLAHYRWSSTQLWNLLRYVDPVFEHVPPSPDVARRHLNHLHAMVLIQLIEALERYLKEVAAVCVDQLVHHVLDDRFDVFKLQATVLVAHFGAETLGKSLCESDTWLDCDKVNKRFQKLLALPYTGNDPFVLFPKQPPDERKRYDTLELIWQLRHSAVHNVGVITQSDAVKFRLLVKNKVDSPRMLSPSRDDLDHLKDFLDETAHRCNKVIGGRLALVLSDLHKDSPGLFDAKKVADRLTQLFTLPLTVDDVTGTAPPPVY
jgi:hypothetical protein